MYETDLSQCKICQKIKVKKYIGKYDANNKKFTNENGKLWVGRICPECHKDRVKHNMRSLRADRKATRDRENKEEQCGNAS
jgi:hypothetical protein